VEKAEGVREGIVAVAIIGRGQLRVEVGRGGVGAHGGGGRGHAGDIWKERAAAGSVHWGDVQIQELTNPGCWR
jgi:hypothetical protein